MRHAWACPGMSGRAPAESAADTPWRRAGNQADQSGADTKPSPSNQELTRSPWTPITAEPAFSSLYGRPGPDYKTLPYPHRLRRLPLPRRLPLLRRPPSLPCLPAPGVLPESDRPIKGPDQRSIGVAPSSRGVSYIWCPTWGSRRGLLALAVEAPLSSTAVVAPRTQAADQPPGRQDTG